MLFGGHGLGQWLRILTCYFRGSPFLRVKKEERVKVSVENDFELKNKLIKKARLG